ncbi:MAG: hypothetical protein NT159_05870 [Proteobacteria bacterium]|nr:hypothetical protein [Pseudomonadota bacterium]
MNTAARSDILGLHEEDRRLFGSNDGFYAVLDRTTETVIAGPFTASESEMAQEAKRDSTRRGIRHAVVSWYSPMRPDSTKGLEGGTA